MPFMALLELRLGESLIVFFQRSLEYRIHYERYGPCTDDQSGQKETCSVSSLYLLIEQDVRPDEQIDDNAQGDDDY